jgi:hypothetical protein
MPLHTLMTINWQLIFRQRYSDQQISRNAIHTSRFDDRHGVSRGSEINCSNGLFSDRTMQALTELIDLNRILLNLARSREFPHGSPRHGYDFIAPLDLQGHIDPLLWKKYRDYCRVRRFWAGEDDEVGLLVHKPGGAEYARWVFDYNPDEDDDDEAGYRFGSHAFLPGEYVSISGQDGKLNTFRVIAVNPVLLSMELIKSFELEIKV